MAFKKLTSNSGRRKSLKPGPAKGKTFLKKIYNMSEHLPRSDSEFMMGGPHLDQVCLDVGNSGLCCNLTSGYVTLQNGVVGVIGSLSLFLMSLH